jgi:hypothetical protein
MADRNLFLANTPLSLLQAAAAARQQGTRAQLLLLEEFELAPRFAAMLRRWRDNPFEAIVRLPGRHEEHRRGPGAQRGAGAVVRRITSKLELRREALAALSALDARFEPDAVWVCDDRKVEAQFALHLASQRIGENVGCCFDNGLQSYLGRVRARPLAHRVDALARRIGYGAWTREVRQAGTSPWIAHNWLAWPAEALDQAPARQRHALPRDWFTSRDFRRLAVLAAREFRIGRRALRACSVVLLLPHSQPLRGDDAWSLRLRRLMAAADACGRRVALKPHPLELESDPFGLQGDNDVLLLPKALPVELLLPLLPAGGLLAGDSGTAILAAHWLRPDLAVRELGAGRSDYARRAQALAARLGIEALDETALIAGVADASAARA